MQGLAGYIIRRLLWAPLILLAVSLATFALGRFGPGDPVRGAGTAHRRGAGIQR
jgi:ABC-type dipeptide/oligopeptide/nickel transport system permease component